MTNKKLIDLFGDNLTDESKQDLQNAGTRAAEDLAKAIYPNEHNDEGEKHV